MIKIALLPALLLTLTLASCTAPGTTHVLNSNVSPDQALALLKAGNERHVKGHSAAKDNVARRRATLAQGQKPFAVVLACADSRTAPEIIFDQQLGSLFVCRVAGNVTDPVVLGSIEYAVKHFNTPLVVVLGHQKCGAVDAAIKGGHLEGNVGALVSRVDPGSGLPSEAAAKWDAGVVNNTKRQVRNVTSQSEDLRKLVNPDSLKIVGGVFSLDTGKVTWVE